MLCLDTFTTEYKNTHIPINYNYGNFMILTENEQKNVDLGLVLG